MSQLSAITINPGVGQSLPIPQQASAIKLTNKSFYDVQFSDFGTEGQEWLAAGTEYMLDAGIANNGRISFFPVNTDNISNPGPGTLLMNVYFQGESLPQGGWPVSIPKSTVNSMSNQTTSVINDGSPAGTTFIEATSAGQSGTPASNVKLTVDGLMQLSVLVAGALVQAIKTQSSGSLLQLGAASQLVEILGNLQVDGTTSLDNGNITTDGAGDIIIKGGKIGKATAGDIVDASGVDTYMKSGGSFFLQSPNGTTVVQVDNQGAIYIHTAGGTAKIGSTAGGFFNFDVNGVRAAQINAGGIDVTTSTPNSITTKNLNINNGGQLNLLAGSLARLTVVSGTGNATINHNLGAMPRVCIPITSSGSSTQSVGATWNSTQVTVVTASGLAWVCLCLA